MSTTSERWHVDADRENFDAKFVFDDIIIFDENQLEVARLAYGSDSDLHAIQMETARLAPPPPRLRTACEEALRLAQLYGGWNPEDLEMLRGAIADARQVETDSGRYSCPLVKE